MACCGGSCSCGKDNRSLVEENIHLIQLLAGQDQLSTFDNIKGLEDMTVDEEVVEVRFKNNRKDFYRNRFDLTLNKDDRIIVEAEGGHDLGTVSLTGGAARKQFEHKSGRKEKTGLKKVYRKATATDLNNWLKAKKGERSILRKARNLCRESGMDLNINDVELQGDGGKVTLLYTTETRMNFQELIKKYRSSLGVKVEMKQIKTSE